MADILHEEIFSSLNFRVQSCPRVGGGGGGGGGSCPPCPPFSYTTDLASLVLGFRGGGGGGGFPHSTALFIWIYTDFIQAWRIENHGNGNSFFLGGGDVRESSASFK